MNQEYNHHLHINNRILLHRARSNVYLIQSIFSDYCIIFPIEMQLETEKSKEQDTIDPKKPVQLNSFDPPSTYNTCKRSQQKSAAEGGMPLARLSLSAR